MIRRSWDRLIFIMGIHLLVRLRLYDETLHPHLEYCVATLFPDCYVHPLPTPDHPSKYWNCYVVLNQPWEDTSGASEIQTWLPDFIMGIKSFMIFWAWPRWAEATRRLGNKTLFFFFINDEKLLLWYSNNYLTEIGNSHNKATEHWKQGHKGHGQLITVGKTSSPWVYVYASALHVSSQWKYLF